MFEKKGGGKQGGQFEGYVSFKKGFQVGVDGLPLKYSEITEYNFKAF